MYYKTESILYHVLVSSDNYDKYKNRNIGLKTKLLLNPSSLMNATFTLASTSKRGVIITIF